MACSFSAGRDASRLAGRLSSQARYSSCRAINLATAAAQRRSRGGAVRRRCRCQRVTPTEPGPASRLALGWGHRPGTDVRFGRSLPRPGIVTVTLGTRAFGQARHQEPVSLFDRSTVSPSRPGSRGAPRATDEADQARYVVERVLESREPGVKLKQQAVLFRASHHSRPLEIELTRRNIPFVKFGGLKFLEAAHVKDLLAVLGFVAFGRAAVRLSQTRLRSTAKGETLPVASAAPTTKEAMPVANLLDAGGRLRSSVAGRLTLCLFQAPSQTSACSGRWVEHTHHFSRLAAFSREGAADAARTRTSSSSSRADTAFHK
jgi:hypothetical protein